MRTTNKDWERQVGLRAAVVAIGLGLVAGMQPVAAAPADSWVLTMSWSPEYCDSRAGSREPQCKQEYYFAYHGLRPLERGARTEACKEDRPSKGLLESLTRVIPNRAVAAELWDDAAGCAGMTAAEYTVQLDRGRRRVEIPERFRKPVDKFDTTPAELEAEFMAVNPGLTGAAVSLQCRRGWLMSVRVCLDGDFGFQACGIEFPDRCKDEIKVRRIRRDRVGIPPG
jgi:ribonuclease T2